MSTGKVALSTTSYVQINTGNHPVILQAQRDAVRVVFNDSQPAVDNTSFHKLSADDPTPWNVPGTDTNIWALAMSTTSSLFVTNAIDIKSKNVGTGGEWLIEVGKGNVPGHSLRTMVAKQPNPSTVFTDIWAGSGDLVYPTANESWEIVSDNVNDTAAGTGARTIVVNYLDVTGVMQEETVTMNGTTPVVVAANCYRPDLMRVASAGSSMTNAGEIKLRVAGAGAERSVMRPGFSRSMDCHVTVPAGHTLFVLQYTPSYEKNQDGRIRALFRSAGVLGVLVDLPFYQVGLTASLRDSILFGENVDILFKANSSNPVGEIDLVVEYMLVDNDYLETMEFGTEVL